MRRGLVYAGSVYTGHLAGLGQDQVTS
jgi:hypothetical protein